MNKELFELIEKLIDAKINKLYTELSKGADGYSLSTTLDDFTIKFIKEDILKYLKKKQNEIHKI